MADECVFWKDGKCTTEKARGTACDGSRTKMNFWSGKIPPECPYPIEKKKGKSHCIYWKRGFCDSEKGNRIDCDGRTKPAGCPYPKKIGRTKGSLNKKGTTPITNCPHTDKPHGAKGMCRSCYQTAWRKEKWKKEPISREKELARMRVISVKRFHKKCAEDPEWNARRQREYRKKNPENYKMSIIKCYLPHLSDENKKKIANMILEEFLKKQRDKNGQKKD